MEILNPALALVEYEKDNVSVQRLTPVAADDCEPHCGLSDPDEWTIYNHMRAREEDYPQAKNCYVQLVLKLAPGTDTQQAGAYHVSVSSAGGGTDMRMTPYWAPDGTCYFIPPWANDSIKSAGRQELRIEYTGQPYETRIVMEVSDNGYRKYRIVINYLESMTLPGCPTVQFREFVGSLRAVQNEKDLIRCILEGKFPSLKGEDDLFYSASLIDQAEYQGTVLDERCGWEGLIGQIDLLLASPVLRVRPHKGEQLHASNLFTCHRLYRRAYALMRQRQEQFSAIDLWSGKSAPVGATHCIYEIWCLLQILSIWIRDYSFTMESHTVRGLVGELLRRTETDVVGPIRLVKKTGALEGMTLELEYNQTFEYQDKKDGRRKILRPDYCMSISYGGKTFRFFMDAKYKNFSEKQMGIEAWYEDLYDVALRKYLFCLDETCSGSTGKTVKTSGSYILHADAKEHRPASGWDPREFFWYKSNAACSNLDPVSSGVLQKVRHKLPGLLECSEDKGDGNVESLRFGSICFTPNTNAHFRILMQMIMEHFLGSDFPDLCLQKCWICGSEDVRAEPRYTANGNRKYYITCQNCKQFWVQTVCVNCGRPLGKHRSNYYRVKLKSVWNVICPDCEFSLSGTDRSVPLKVSAEQLPF